MSCSDVVCGTGGWTGPKPGDPDNNLLLSASPAFGGIDVNWTYPASNPHAVSFVKLYRASTDNFDLALQIANVSGSFYYDKLTTGAIYYYWIKVVSINGTEGELIGPASATAKPLIEDMITLLSGKIDQSLLAQALTTDIGKITNNYDELMGRINERIAVHAALSAALEEVQTGLVDAMTFIGQEITSRTNGDSALVNVVNSIAAANRDNLALIQQESAVRVGADSALGLRIDSVVASSSNAAALVETERLARVSADGALGARIDAVAVAATNASAAVTDITSAKIGYSAIGATSVPFDGDGATVVYPIGKYPAASYPEYAADRTRIIDKIGVTQWNATPAGSIKQLTWLSGLPLASAIKKVGVTGPNGEVASLEQGFIAQKDLNGKFKAMYTAKIQSTNSDGTKIIGGFGIEGDAVGIAANFDVDTFSVGRTNGAKRKPFMVEGGSVYIDDAAINKLTFNKLRDEAGSFIVENGKLKANYIHVERIMGGGYTRYDWPTSGQNGFYLGPEGFALGNYNNNNYFWVEANGNIRTPGFSVINGVMSVNQINVIKTANILGRSATSVDSINGVDNASVEVFLSGVSGEVYDVVLLATAQQPKSGFFRLRDNGDDVIVGLGEGLTSISWCLTGAANSTHIYQTIADFGIQCVLTVFVSKR